MPISVVVGGQFGSEGKGKTAYEIAIRNNARIVVRVGGTNSGHTAVDKTTGKTWALRQLPVSVLAPRAIAVLPAGALIDPEIFVREVRELGLGPDRVAVSKYATVISDRDKLIEKSSGLISRIGSTGSGTGAALIRRIERNDVSILAANHSELKPYVTDTSELMRSVLNRNEWIVIEGSQGFGLSVLHGGYYPKATSRDTTASTFLGEAALSPRDVQDVTLVIRAHPIRVAGDSGPLRGETTWAEIAKTAGLPKEYQEFTTATRKVRRVGTFDPSLVKKAIDANNPSRIVLNHFDYVDSNIHNHQRFTARSFRFLQNLEKSISHRIDWVGTGPADFVDRAQVDTGNVIIRPQSM